MNTSKQQLKKSDELLRVKDVARMLSISPNSVYRLKDAGLIRHYKLKSGIRFMMRDVQEYLSGCCVGVSNNEYEYGSKKNKRKMVRRRST